MTVDQDQNLDLGNAHQPRTTTFERALALLDEPVRSNQASQRRPRLRSSLDADGESTFSSTSMDASLHSTALTSPPRRRTRTSHPNTSLSGSPLKDYLKRHSTESQGSEAERASTSTPRASSSSHTDRGHRAGDRSGSTSTSMSTSTPRNSTEMPSRQTFTRDPFLDDQTIETGTSTPTGTRTGTGEERSSATASLYVSPRRPLRSSIFESSPRIPLPSPSHSTSASAVASTSPRMTSREREVQRERKRDYSYERPRQTSATLRYALETSVRQRPLRQDQDQDGYSDGEEQGDGDGDGNGEDVVRAQGRSQRGHPGHASFLDTESDPPTELDERFPAIDPAPRSSPRPPHPTDPNTLDAGRPEEHSHVQSTTSSSTSKSVDRGLPEQDIWRETESDYIRLPKTVTVSTPPELASVKGIDVEHLRSYVNGRAREARTMEDDYVDDEAGFAATHSAPVGWTSRHMLPDLPLSRRDLEETVQGLRDEMESMRLQLETVVKTVGAGSKQNENENITPVQPDLPQHVLNALMTIDALIHHTSLNERSPEQVLSVGNIEEMTRRIQDWEAIVRGRQSSSPSPVPVTPIETGQQHQ